MPHLWDSACPEGPAVVGVADNARDRGYADGAACDRPDRYVITASAGTSVKPAALRFLQLDWLVMGATLRMLSLASGPVITNGGFARPPSCLVLELDL